MLDRRRLLALGGASLVAGCTPRVRSTSLIDDIQRRTFRYFWETTDARTGLAPDRWPTPSFCSIAAVGFALTAYPIGVVNGWVTRVQARARTLTTLDFLAAARQGPEPGGVSGSRGFFYHFLDMTTGQRFGRCELSTIDTTLLLGGVLFAASFFDGDDPDERRIRDLADRLYAAVEWDWITPRKPYVAMGWHPETGFIASDWRIYDESQLLYLLAIGSPTHPLPADSWNRWTAGFKGGLERRWGQPHIGFPPLFGHQYSQLWVEFRGIGDRLTAAQGFDYFENSRRATLAQRGYAIANPGGWRGYDADVWGLTACDGPGDFAATIDGRARTFHSYSARGPGERDDGTIAPTAALGSIAFAPEVVVPAAEAMHRRYGHAIYGAYGFRDSFNPTLTDATLPLRHGRILPGVGWVADDHLGIDQGPIVGGIENCRSGLIWRTMRRNPHLRRGLTRAGFAGGWLAAGG